MASVRMEDGAMEVHTRRSDYLKDALALGSGRQDSRKRELHKQDLEAKGKRTLKKKMRKIIWISWALGEKMVLGKEGGDGQAVWLERNCGRSYKGLMQVQDGI